MKRVLIVVALLVFPVVSWADATDPQIDPNNCTGSLSLTMFNQNFTLLNASQVITNSFSALDVTNLNNPQPDSCVANNTGGIITSLTVTTPDVPGNMYGCPSDPSVTCNVTVDDTNHLVTFSFTGLNIGVGKEFGFTETGFGGGGFFAFKDLTSGAATFNFTAPEPASLSLLGGGTFFLWASLRRRKRA